MENIVFLTGTRADYGKIKSIIKAVENSESYEAYLYVTGMHVIKEYGYTCDQIIQDGFKNVFVEKDINLIDKMDINLANTIIKFSKYISEIAPNFIVVHGDRIDALAAAIVGILNNIRVIHIEGGELTGTVDDSLRHSITKLSHLHFVANRESKIRLEQLGEKSESIKIIGSPDIDIMLSEELPTLEYLKAKWNIQFEKYALFMYHPVTTELDKVEEGVDEIINALIKSKRNYICIYPNNDHGSDKILKKIKELRNNKNILLVESFPFEEFLTLLKYSDFIIGNSSAGIREACVYGIPSINIGSRQFKRFPERLIKNIQNVNENCNEILECIDKAHKYRYVSSYFGHGNSANLFIDAMKDEEFVTQSIQKSFIDLPITEKSIQTYINEVCF